MVEIDKMADAAAMAISSSLKDDVWHEQARSGAFECWHFDALSDDHREAVVLTFHDNCPFSPRYFRQNQSRETPDAGLPRTPAVSFVYSIDGKVVLRAVNEFGSEDFKSGPGAVACEIGGSSFRIEAADYGTGFLLHIELNTPGKRQIKADLEWIAIESDLDNRREAEGSTCWNIVAPRADVSGRISTYVRNGDPEHVFHFRGTGYHDHLRSDRPPGEAAGSRYWGRAHFVDRTVVFQQLRPGPDAAAVSHMFLVNDGRLERYETKSEMQSPRLDRFGVRVPGRTSFAADDGLSLEAKPVLVLQSGFFVKRVLTEMTLKAGDGKVRKTFGIAEMSCPERMKNPLYRWPADLWIGKNGKAPLF